MLPELGLRVERLASSSFFGDSWQPSGTLYPFFGVLVSLKHKTNPKKGCPFCKMVTALPRIAR